MLKVLTAFTKEIDYVNKAVDEIVSTLSPNENFLKNTVGIINCHQEFIESGVVRELHKILGIDTIGWNTIINATNKEEDEFQLSITVLTSDDCDFAVGFSNSLGENPESELQNLTQRLRENRKNNPSLMIAAAPLLTSVSADTLIAMLDKVSDGIPCYGAVAANYVGAIIDNCRTIYNGEDADDKLALLMIYGDIDVQFTHYSIPEHKIIKKNAVITKAYENIICEINNMPVYDYLDEIGFLDKTDIGFARSVPIIIEYKGIGRLPRNIFNSTPENYASCSASIPQGGEISLASIDYDDIMETTKDLVAEICEKKPKAVIFVSCGVRNMNLGVKVLDEAKMISEIMPPEIPYMFSYSAGEICPANGKNFLHNDTLTCCMIF